MNVTKSQFFWGILFVTSIISLVNDNFVEIREINKWVATIVCLVFGIIFANVSAKNYE